MSSRITQLTLGVFTATFVFSLSVLRYVKGANENGGNFVPQTSVTLAFALVLASVACFVAFIHLITTSIQVAHVISRIGDNTVDALDAVYPATPDDDDTPRHGPTWSPVEGAPRVPVLVRDRHGSVTHIDAQALIDLLPDSMPSSRWMCKRASSPHPVNKSRGCGAALRSRRRT